MSSKNRSNKKIKKDNSLKILIILALFSIFISIVFFSHNLSGYATYNAEENRFIGLANMNPQITNLVGTILLIIGLIAAIIWYIRSSNNS
ncbi:MAG: hypothetical protein Q8N99_08075 [Nanoarchaeota archaeon]|nr:hypothetical protein [Nanoarchaeota archaeon]